MLRCRSAKAPQACVGRQTVDKMKDKTASERIRKAREEIGLTAEQVAQRLSLSVAWYHDLESYSDEVFSNISLAHLQLLAGIIRIEPRHILLGEQTPAPRVSGQFQDVSDGLKRKMIARGIDSETLSEQVGWNVREVLIDSQELWNFTVDGLRDLCEFAEVDWLSALPGLP